MFGTNKNKFPQSVEYIVAGLGNPDRKYEKTRHNAGFITLDAIGEELGMEFKQLKFKSYCSTAEISGHKVLFIKPQTYMNDSGRAVTEAMAFYKVPPEKTIIIFDDINLDVGKMRIRKKGSDGGQKGMRSIIYLSGSDLFPRIKIGIGKKPNPNWDLAAWVLSEFSQEELQTLNQVTKNALPAIELIINGKTEQAMNKFNS